MAHTHRELEGHTRRAFLCQCCSALGAAALTFERFGLVNAFAQTGDYKALVCIFLGGGNDSGNVLIPHSGYDEYSAVRNTAAALQIPQDSLLPINPQDPVHQGLTFGLHPSMTGLHNLWEQGKVAAICNVGPLLQPITRAEYLANPGLRPPQLFSHSDQVNQWQTTRGRTVSPTGWGGRIADKVAVLNPGDIPFPMMATLAGVTIFGTGRTQRSLAVPAPPGAPVRLEGFPNPPENDPRYQAMQELLTIDQDKTLVRGASSITVTAISSSQLLQTLDPIPPGTFPATNLGRQLERVAQVIKMGRGLGLRRQLFFCSIGGFDTHTNQIVAGDPTTGNHANLWNQVSGAMKAFYDWTADPSQGFPADVTTFTLSDFSRTFKPNNDLGSDHGWGAHQFVVGGSVLGSNFYGEFPPLTLNGGLDTDTGAGARGRWIPTTAVDQYGATLAKWYGVEDADMPAVFPNLGAFGTGDLGFLG